MPSPLGPLMPKSHDMVHKRSAPSGVRSGLERDSRGDPGRHHAPWIDEVRRRDTPPLPSGRRKLARAKALSAIGLAAATGTQLASVARFAQLSKEAELEGAPGPSKSEGSFRGGCAFVLENALFLPKC